MIHSLSKCSANREFLDRVTMQHILTNTNSLKYYSIILDRTPGVRHVDQLTMIKCFVDRITPLDNEMSEPIVMVREDYLGFAPLKGHYRCLYRRNPFGKTKVDYDVYC